MNEQDQKIKKALENLCDIIEKEKDSVSIKEYVEYIEKGLLFMAKNWLEDGYEKAKVEYAKELIWKDLTQYMKRDEKFRGKRVKKSRMKMYEEIKKKYEELNAEGANVGYVTAANIVAKKYDHSSEKLYQSFKKWQNRQSAKPK